MKNNNESTGHNLPLLKQVFCGYYSPLGAIMDFLVGSARTCYCCSFWRGGLYGACFGWLTYFLLEKLIS